MTSRIRKQIFLRASVFAAALTLAAAPVADVGSAAGSKEPAQVDRNADGTGNSTNNAPASSVKSPAPVPARQPVRKPGTAGATAALSSVSSTKGAYVYTNEDLGKFALPGDGAAGGAGLKQAKEAQDAFDADARKRQQQQPAAEAYKAKLKSDAEERVRLVQAKVENLKWLALSEKNPLVPPPSVTPDQKKEREILPLDQRVKKTHEEIAQAEAELEAARANLRDVLRQLAEAR